MSRILSDPGVQYVDVGGNRVWTKPDAHGWQPIETAPKDGTWVLLRGGDSDYGWDHGESKPPAVVGQWALDGGCWQFAWYDSGYYGEYTDPTDWMPLPA